MEPIALGIDVVELSRIRGVYERYRDRFLARVYTDEERRQAARLANPVGFLAGRFAVKEAVLKALGTGLGRGVSWQDLHVGREPSGLPRVRLRGRALERARDLGLGRILVSLSHGRELAVAQVLGLRGDPGSLSLDEQRSC